MFKTLAEKIPRDRDLPERAWRLAVMRAVMDGTIYDTLRYPFHCERTDGGEYIPLRDRRPSVRYNLSRMVVQDSVTLLFGDGHFPIIDLPDQKQRNGLADLLDESRLAQSMVDAAMRGAVGSVAVLMRVLNGRIFFSAIDTDFLTPEYDPQEPDKLMRVTERYKVKGADLAASGYSIQDDQMSANWWFQRVWDREAETWFTPTLCAGTNQASPFRSVTIQDQDPQIDAERTVRHGLGFVPMVWIKNLPGGAGIDGGCTFDAAIDTQIEIEYQLSQVGRGLKYSSDPLLMIREPASQDSGQMVRSAANALVVSENGDAKLLEINGTAAEAVITYVRTLRESAIESIHGNRSNADKVSAAQSGRALEMMHQPLIWLADQLRTSYGDNGVLPLVRMAIAAARKLPIKVRGKVVGAFDGDPSLRWPSWFPATGADRQQEAASLSTLTNAGLLSRQTAVKVVAGMFDIEDAKAELDLIAADEAASVERATALGAKVTATDPLPE